MRSLVLVALCVAACSKPSGPIPELPWVPGAMYRAPREANARGFLDRRGLIHSHSVHSHDACDGRPVTDAGTYDEQCYDDFRDGLCRSGHDFAFLTDHRDSFDDVEFPDTLLYRQARGDELVEHGAGPTASRMFCPQGAEAPLVMAGNETDVMPVGLERHADGRGATYGGNDAASVQKIHEAGGLAIMAHTEKWAAQQLIDMKLDGFEMYNLHANTFKNLGIAADWALRSGNGDYEGIPNPQIFLIGYQLEDPAYLTTWGTALASGARFVTTMGTDCHRNSLPQLAQDGERIDSYRRMMSMFSNHLLVRAGAVDDRALKEALAAGRLYGVFEFMGYAEGFSFVAQSGGATHELGAEVPVGAVLEVTMPQVEKLPGDVEPPVLSLHLYRARVDGWDEVASGSEGTLSFTTVAAGAYRAEVRMVPRHLKRWVGKRLDLIKTARPWVYSNAIYVK